MKVPKFKVPHNRKKPKIPKPALYKKTQKNTKKTTGLQKIFRIQDSLNFKKENAK